jgi:hypothetical protein
VDAHRIILLLVVLGCVLALTQKIREMRGRPRDELRLATCVLIGGFGASAATQLFGRQIDRATGVLNLGSTLSDVAVMVAACGGQVFLLHAGYPVRSAQSKARWCYPGLAVALTAVVILVLVMPVHETGLDIPAATRRADHAVYLYVYLTYIAATLVAAWNLCLRYSGLTDQLSLKIGLRVIAAGAACGLGYLTLRAAILVGDELGGDLAVDWDPRYAFPLEVLTEALILAGVVIPALGTRLTAVSQWLSWRRAHRALYPLWHALHQVDPSLTLVPMSPPNGPWRHRDAEFMLYRLIIEIRDGQLALRPYADPRAAEIATGMAREAGLDEHRVRATGEAATLAAAIAAKAAGTPVTPPSGTTSGTGGGIDLRTETAWLRPIAEEFTASPIVDRTLTELGHTR